MFGVGLSIQARDFKYVFTKPRAILVALIAQLIGLPLIAFALCSLWSLTPALKMGLIILAACPGGATSNFLSYLWRGNVALSLSLTAINSFLTLFTIPLVVNLGLNIFMGKETEIHLPFWDTVIQIFSITLIPATIGVLLKYYRSDWATRIEKPAKYIMLVLLFLVFSIKLFAGKSYGGSGLSMQDFFTLTPYALVQNLCCLCFGYFVLFLAKKEHPTRLTGAIESGVQNTTLAFLIAGTLLDNQEMIKPALIYSMYSFWTACIFAYLSNRHNRPGELPYDMRDFGE